MHINKPAMRLYRAMKDYGNRSIIKERRAGITVFVCGVGVLLVLVLCGLAFGAENGTESSHVKRGEAIIEVNTLANAIYQAEGGAKTRHPYGILKKYKTTTPRQACINTIKHALRDWDGRGDFIVFLGARYCPIGAKNDPNGLNKNWIKNVKYFYYQLKGGTDERI